MQCFSMVNKQNEAKFFRETKIKEVSEVDKTNVLWFLEITGDKTSIKHWQQKHQLFQADV